MRIIQRRIISLLCIAVLVCALTACPKKESLVFWAEQVVSVASDIIPILSANGKDTKRAEQFRLYGTKLVAAIKANDGTALGYAASCIDLLQEIAADAESLPQGKRTTALVILAVAEVALRRLADNLPKEGVASDGDAVAKLTAWKNKRAWRCRDSATGRYTKMAVCRERPDSTTVETR